MYLKTITLSVCLLTTLLAPVGAGDDTRTETRILSGAAVLDWSGGGRLYDMGHFSDAGSVRVERTETYTGGELTAFRVQIDHDGPLVSIHCVNDDGDVSGTIDLRAIRSPHPETMPCHAAGATIDGDIAGSCQGSGLVRSGYQFSGDPWALVYFQAAGACA